jgi:Uma2 family endonuclease
MQSTSEEKIRWTSTDLDFFPRNGNIYEVIDGDLHVTKAPHWRHQTTCTRIGSALDSWSIVTGLGRATSGAGIIFSDSDNVIPDVVWISNDRFSLLIDASGHLTGAPELVVEVISEGTENEQRDRETKLKLYSRQGVQEYWIVNWRSQSIAIYRRQRVTLILIETLLVDDELTSPLLPGFALPIAPLFS